MKYREDYVNKLLRELSNRYVYLVERMRNCEKTVEKGVNISILNKTDISLAVSDFESILKEIKKLK